MVRVDMLWATVTILLASLEDKTICLARVDMLWATAIISPAYLVAQDKDPSKPIKAGLFGSTVCRECSLHSQGAYLCSAPASSVCFKKTTP